MPKVKIAGFNEIPEGGMKRVNVDEKPIALYKLSGQIFATSNICTHEGCFLDENHNILTDVIECTCHGTQFDIKTGAVILPPAVVNLPTYKVEVVGNDIYIDK